MANAGVVAATADAAPDALLPPLPDALTSAALYRAMVRLIRPDPVGHRESSQQV